MRAQRKIDVEQSESHMAAILGGKLTGRLVWDDSNGHWYERTGESGWHRARNTKALAIIRGALDDELPEGYSLRYLKAMAEFLKIG